MISPAPMFISPSTTPSRLSPSALERYRQCPRSFWFADVERAPRPEVPTPILVQANAIHHALERFYGLPPKQRQPEHLERALRSVWPTHRKPGSFATRDEEARCGTEALELLRSYAARFALQAVPLARERWVSTRLPNGIEIFGKVDRIDSAIDGGLELIDYKTGKRRLEPEDLAGESAAQVYLIAAERLYRTEVRRVRFVFLRSAEELVWEPERDDVAGIGERLVELTSSITSDERFEAVPGTACRFCDFAHICPESSRVSLAELQPVEGLPF